jgi:poly(3-hydroxybutyrate) depolymerase
MSGSLNGTCAATTPLAYWASHGTNDPTIAITAGESARDQYRQRNHCGTQSTATTPAGCIAYQGCDAGSPVEWCPFTGVHQPHPMAGAAIWAFLSRF